MRGPQRAREALAVSVQGPVRVVLDITRTTTTISGELAVEGAAASCFYGWLELIDALERVAGPVLEPHQAVNAGERPCEQ